MAESNPKRERCETQRRIDRRNNKKRNILDIAETKRKGNYSVNLVHNYLLLCSGVKENTWSN